MWKKTPHNRLELETYCRVNTTRPCFKGKPGSANYYSVCNCIFPGLYGACFFFFNRDSLHARPNSHHKACSYKKKKHKNIKAYRKSV